MTISHKFLGSVKIPGHPETPYRTFMNVRSGRKPWSTVWAPLWRYTYIRDGIVFGASIHGGTVAFVSLGETYSEETPEDGADRIRRGRRSPDMTAYAVYDQVDVVQTHWQVPEFDGKLYRSDVAFGIQEDLILATFTTEPELQRYLEKQMNRRDEMRILRKSLDVLNDQERLLAQRIKRETTKFTGELVTRNLQLDPECQHQKTHCQRCRLVFPVLRDHAVGLELQDPGHIGIKPVR